MMWLGRPSFRQMAVAGWLLSVLCLVVSSTVPVDARPPAEPTFAARDVSGFQDDLGVSRGVAWGDMDNDGLADLVISNTNDQPLFLYRNLGDRQFLKISSGPVAEFKGYAEGVSWIDYDNDGWLDLFVSTTRGPNALFRNLGEGKFARIRGGEFNEEPINTSMACWADYDRDGYLDVLLATRGRQPDRLYRNIAGRAFERADVFPRPAAGNDARSCAWGDFNGDGWPDFHIGNFLTRARDGSDRKAVNMRFQNVGGESFTRIVTGHAVNYPTLTYGLTPVDFDQDGDLDLFETNIGSTDQNILYENIVNHGLYPRFDQIVTRASLGPSKGQSWGDFDLDGHIDVAIAEGTEGLTADDAPYDVRNKLFFGTGSNFLRAESGAFVEETDISAGIAWADMDLDGDLDLAVANWGDDGQKNGFFENMSDGDWIAFQLIGTRSNRMGIGTIVTVRIVSKRETRTFSRTFWPQTGYASANEPIVHFGLGRLDNNVMIEVELKWPSGTVQTVIDLSPNIRLQIIEK